MLFYSFLFYRLCLVLVSESCWSHRMSWEQFPPLLFFFSFFARVWERLVLISLLIFSRIHHWNHLVQSFSLLRVLKLLTQSPAIDLFKFSVSSWVSFDSFWPISYLGVCCFIFTYLWIPQISWYWVLILFHCGQRVYFVWLQSFKMQSFKIQPPRQV